MEKILPVDGPGFVRDFWPCQAPARLDFDPPFPEGLAPDPGPKPWNWGKRRTETDSAPDALGNFLSLQTSKRAKT